MFLLQNGLRSSAPLSRLESRELWGTKFAKACCMYSRKVEPIRPGEGKVKAKGVGREVGGWEVGGRWVGGVGTSSSDRGNPPPRVRLPGH